MQRFVQMADRQQTTLLPECLDDWVDESNPVLAVDVFVEALDLRGLGFEGVVPAATGPLSSASNARKAAKSTRGFAKTRTLAQVARSSIQAGSS